MDKLSMASRRLQIVVITFMFLTPLALVVTVLTDGWGTALALPEGVEFNATAIGSPKLLVLILLSSITAISHLVAYGFVYRLLGLYRQGMVFTAANVMAIRHIGWALIAIDVAHMFKTLITGPVLTVLGVTSPYMSAGIQIAFLIVGLFIVLVSYVIDMGRELKEQDSLVI